MTTSIEKAILRLVLRHGPVSRARVQELSGMRKMTVYEGADALVRRGLLREGIERRLPRGRPERPLELPRDQYQVAGILVGQDRVEATRVSLLGEPQSSPLVRTLTGRTSVVAAVRASVEHVCDRNTIAVGIAVTGFLDVASATLLPGTPLPAGVANARRPVSLAEVIRDVAAPVVIQNDLQAIAARWVLTERLCQEPTEDLLMVYLDDGKIGAAILVAGRPNEGCVGGANELGHTRLAVETELCYCGCPSGCLERVFSSVFLSKINKRAARSPLLLEALAGKASAGQALERVVDLVGTGIASAINLMRSGRLVLTGPAVASDAGFAVLSEAIRRHTLGTIESRLHIERWALADPSSATSAGCLPIAHLMMEGWPAARMTHLM